MIFFSLHTSKQATKFFVIGVLSTAVNYGIFFILLQLFHFYYVIAAIAGYVSGLMIGFVLNRSWTFQSLETRVTREALLYGGIYFFSLVMSMLFLRLLVSAFGFDPRFANVCAIGLSTIINFLGCKFFVFRKRSV